MINFLSVFPPFRGGISRFSEHVYTELSKYDDVDAINFIKQYPDFLFPGATQIIDDPNPFKSRRIVHSYNPINWLGLKKHIQLNSDVFIYSFWHPFLALSSLSTLNAARKKNAQTKSIALIHNVLPHESFPFQKLLVKQLFRKTDLLITLSTQGTQAIRDLDENLLEKTQQLFHPFYTPKYPNLEKKEAQRELNLAGKRVLLFFGLIRGYKGLDLLIDAYKEIKNENDDLVLLIAGEFYDDKEKYVNQIDERIADSVIIMDRFISEREMALCLKASEVIILPYKHATQSGVLADAIAYDLPAIVTKQPGFTDVIINHKHGIVLEDRTKKNLVASLTNYTQSDLATWESEINKLKENMSWERFGKDLFNLMK